MVSSHPNGIVREGTGNGLLDRLPWSEFSRLDMEAVNTPPGKEVYRLDCPMAYVYFPTTGVYSIVIPGDDGQQVEAATVGNEGMLGVYAALGLGFSPVAANLQIPGKALRITTSAFVHAMKPGGALETIVRRYTAYALRHASQTIACNLLHSAGQRICRWLLMTQDRAGQDEFPLTHEYLAEMLGVRRQTVTTIARSLQGAGLIDYCRGLMRVANRGRLETASCECYRANRTLYKRLLQ